MSPPPSDVPASNPLTRALGDLLYAAQVTEYQFRRDADVIRAFRYATPDLVLQLHADGTLLDVKSSPALNLFRDTAQVLQRNLAELLPPEPAQAIRAALDQTLREQKPITCECTLTIDAEAKHLEARVIALHPRQALVIVRDITAQHQALQQLRDLSRRLVNAQEDERRRLSNDLHDEIGQDLTGIALLLEQIATLSDETARQKLDQARALIQGLINQVRNLARDLRPAVLDDIGLLPALVTLTQRYQAQTGIHVRVHARGCDRRFVPEVETAAYRIVQEALTNVARHAQVERASVKLRAEGKLLRVAITDHGPGFDLDDVSRAGLTFGLDEMRERAKWLGGQLTIQTAPGRGTHVMAELPIEDPSERS